MDEKKLKKGYNGYQLTDHARSQLLEHVERMFDDVIAHHVTYEFGVYESLPPDTNLVRVTAVANNDRVQAAVVKVNSTTQRPDGRTYHVTVSLDRSKGAKPVDSNDMLDDLNNWRAIDPFNLEVTPTFFSF
jgi:hypothetical protein